MLLLRLLRVGLLALTVRLSSGFLVCCAILLALCFSVIFSLSLRSRFLYLLFLGSIDSLVICPNVLKMSTWMAVCMSSVFILDIGRRFPYNFLPTWLISPVGIFCVLEKYFSSYYLEFYYLQFIH